MIFVLRRYWSGSKKRRRIHLTPAEREKKDGKKKPPFWTRTALILSAIGVSFSHGANDGQKGIGLIMLVLIGVAPAGFMVNMNASGYDIAKTYDAVVHLQQYYQTHQPALDHAIENTPAVSSEFDAEEKFHCDSSRTVSVLNQTEKMLEGVQNYNELVPEQRTKMRRLLMCISDTSNAVAKLPETSAEDARFLKTLSKDLLHTVEYAPLWIIIAVALALSIGTMFGWKRVAVTIGEKIGKKGMTYAQGFLRR